MLRFAEILQSVRIRLTWRTFIPNLGNAHVWLSLLVLLGSLLVHLRAPEFIEPLRNRLFDQYQRVSPRQYTPLRVRIVDIDEESLDRLGQWPWPRTRLADLIHRLRDEFGAAAIEFDIILAEPDRTSPPLLARSFDDNAELRQLLEQRPDHDQIFADAIAGGRVVLGFALESEHNDGGRPANKSSISGFKNWKLFVEPDNQGTVRSLPVLEKSAAGNASVSFDSKDGVVRYAELLRKFQGSEFKGLIYPSLALEALRVAMGAPGHKVEGRENLGIERVRLGRLRIPTDKHGRVWMHFTPSVEERYISAWRLFDEIPDDKKISGEIFKNSVVLVGSSAPGLMDLRASPLGTIVPGVEAHAQAIEQLMLRSYLTRPIGADATEAIFVAVLWLAFIIFFPRFGSLWSAILGIAAVAAAWGTSWYAFTELR